MKNDYEEFRLSQKADWLRLAADIVGNSDTIERAKERLEQVAKDAEEARDAYNKSTN